MLDKKIINPYIRVAMHSVLTGYRIISDRTLYDYEIIFVKDGKCNITYDNTRYTVKKNQVVFIRPGVKHKFEIRDNIRFIQPHIHFDAVYNKNSEITTVSFKPKENMTNNELKLIQNDIFEHTDIPFVFTPDNIQKFEKTLFEIIEIFSKRGHNYELLCKSKLLELLCLMLDQFETEKRTDDGMGASNSVTASKEYIDNNFLFEITLDSLAEQLYINKFTLMRKFKSKYGINIIEYYRKKRVDFAKNLLINTDYSIYTIGEILNFSDIYSFSRFFKRQEKISPVSFRKKMCKYK